MPAGPGRAVRGHCPIAQFLFRALSPEYSMSIVRRAPMPMLRTTLSGVVPLRLHASRSRSRKTLKSLVRIA
jgi:hypothetical protein